MSAGDCTGLQILGVSCAMFVHVFRLEETVSRDEQVLSCRQHLSSAPQVDMLP